MIAEESIQELGGLLICEITKSVEHPLRRYKGTARKQIGPPMNANEHKKPGKPAGKPNLCLFLPRDVGSPRVRSRGFAAFDSRLSPCLLMGVCQKSGKDYSGSAEMLDG
jgi:hypothetical protein